MAEYRKPDSWSIKARKEGYPARSVYKLKEIDEKFALVKKGARILDLGAAPGSWSLWCLRRLAGSGFIVSCDLEELGIKPPYANFSFIRGDLSSEPIRLKIRAAGPYDLILSDAAPFTSGNRLVDTGRSMALVEAALRFGVETLRAGGSLVAKLFQGGDEGELAAEARRLFSGMRFYKPKACRSESFETYLIATGFRGTGR